MRKRITSTIIALLAIVSMARGATNYGLWIAGFQITSDNYYNIGNMIEDVGYGISFDPQTATLTLNNAYLNITDNNYERSAIEFYKGTFTRFTVKLIGDNYLGGCPYALFLGENVQVFIDGPGTLSLSAISLNMSGYSQSAASIWMKKNSFLSVRNVDSFSFKDLYGESGTSLTFVMTPVTIYDNVHDLGYLELMSAKFQNPNHEFRNGQIVNKSTGAAVKGVSIMSIPTGDFNLDGIVNQTDAQWMLSYKLGEMDYDDPAQFDLNLDGNLTAADFTMLTNYRAGTRPSRWRGFFYLHELISDNSALSGTDYSFVYDSSHKTMKWVMIDFMDGGDLVDNNASHFYCSSSDPSVATVSITNANTTMPSSTPTKAYLVTVNKSGTATITFGYDDKAGNCTEMKLTISFFTQSEMLASGDKIYGVRLNESTIENINLDPWMYVPVGTTIKLSIDKDVTYGYDLDTRKLRMACTTWEVTGNEKVVLKKTDEGYVKVYVLGAGDFTVTARDNNKNQRSIGFKAVDVYTHDDSKVYKNGKTVFSVPETKISQIFGKAKSVMIKKMITLNTHVYTVVNHYTKTNEDSEVGSIVLNVLGNPVEPYFTDSYTIPIFAQVYRDGNLIYESEDTYIEDVAGYSVSDLTVVGYKYDPNLSYGGCGYDAQYAGSYQNSISLRLSTFYAVLDVVSGNVFSRLNCSNHSLESNLTSVAYDQSTGDILMYGYLKRRRSTESWTHTTYCYPRDWVFFRWNNAGTTIKEAWRRDKNDNWTYLPKSLVVAKNRPVGICRFTYYAPSHIESFYENIPRFDFAPYGDFPDPCDYLMYDFSDTDGGNSISLEDDDEMSITSSSDSGSLYGWKNNKVYKFADDFKSYDTYRTYKEIRYIKQLEVKLNPINHNEEFFTVGYKSDYKTAYIISALGEAVLPWCSHFSLMY